MSGLHVALSFPSYLPSSSLSLALALSRACGTPGTFCRAAHRKNGNTSGGGSGGRVRWTSATSLGATWRSLERSVTTGGPQRWWRRNVSRRNRMSRERQRAPAVAEGEGGEEEEEGGATASVGRSRRWRGGRRRRRLGWEEAAVARWPSPPTGHSPPRSPTRPASIRSCSASPRCPRTRSASGSMRTTRPTCRRFQVPDVAMRRRVRPLRRKKRSGGARLLAVTSPVPSLAAVEPATAAATAAAVASCRRGAALLLSRLARRALGRPPPFTARVATTVASPARRAEQREEERDKKRGKQRR
uniref:Uncharacterized protein n=1 Tax=Oryza sativa subsp. japonica TaxID=39947 RepID=Q5Z778_ORYSJ|nr:hypothetical protein [Oryza sativa Japonica Group]